MKGRSVFCFLLIFAALFIALVPGCGIEQEEQIDQEDLVEAAEPVKYVQIEKTLIRVEADPDKGFHLPYYLSVPSLRIPEGQLIYLLIVSNGSHPASNDFALHEESALQLASESRDAFGMSRDLGVPLMVPVIPRPPGNTMYQVLNRESLQVTSGQLARVDLQVIAMIADAQERLAEMEVLTKEKVLFNGFSSAGTFAQRFTMLHPEMVAAAAGGGNLAIPLPIEEWEGELLTYNVGVGDLELLIGKPFDPEEFFKVPMFVYIGGDDPKFQDDLAQYNGWYTREQAAQIWRLFGTDVRARWEQTQEIYNEHYPNVQFRTYEGYGHESSSGMNADVIAFFRKIINE